MFRHAEKQLPGNASHLTIETDSFRSDSILRLSGGTADGNFYRFQHPQSPNKWALRLESDPAATLKRTIEAYNTTIINGPMTADARCEMVNFRGETHLAGESTSNREFLKNFSGNPLAKKPKTTIN